MDPVRGRSVLPPIATVPETEAASFAQHAPQPGPGAEPAPPAVVADHFQFMPLEEIGTRGPAPPLPFEQHGDVGQVSFRLQGDPSMYTEDALDRRRRLSQHPTVLACIDLFWNVVRGPSDNVTREQYTALHLRLNKALHRQFHVHHARILSMQEAQRDLGHAAIVTKAMFRKALFEVVDHWTLQIDLHHYVDFLIQLFLRISELKAGIDPSVSIQDLLLRMLSGSVENASGHFMQLRLLNGVSWMEPGPDGDWSQQVPGSVRVQDLIASHRSRHPLSPDDEAFWIDPLFKKQYFDGLKEVSADDRKKKINELMQKGLVSADDLLYMMQNGLLSTDDLLYMIEHGLISPEKLAALIAANPALLSAIGDPVRFFSQLQHLLPADVLDKLTSAMSAHGIDLRGTLLVSAEKKTRLLANLDSRLQSLRGRADDDSDGVLQITPVITQSNGPRTKRRSRRSNARTDRVATLIETDDVAVDKRGQDAAAADTNVSGAATASGLNVAEIEARRGSKRTPAKYAAAPPSGPVYRKLKKELYYRLLRERIGELQMEPASMNGLDKHANIVWDTDALTSPVAGLNIASVLGSLPRVRARNATFIRKPLRPLIGIREAPRWKVRPDSTNKNAKLNRYPDRDSDFVTASPP